ncbi:hypothetical protein C922_03469 [Plasmodium inui San Antonio 1]|uniref:Uncharacterized protein n=1 Tax=Plasmodium inui San Antonio 1 TaxID=1237626 RepID=W7AB29_9APIC|nr:hypothetical protein C922_03469 [Plasmodium inui San Antonio 1]EUD66274.1 hypothetical protein C922_03469 [Plasmodium inui San Antonio 1]
MVELMNPSIFLSPFDVRDFKRINFDVLRLSQEGDERRHKIEYHNSGGDESSDKRSRKNSTLEKSERRSRGCPQGPEHLNND